MRKYYDEDGYMNEQEFLDRLKELHDMVDDKLLPDLLKIRNALYQLKHKYEQSGSRFLECEYEIEALNGIIGKDRRE